MPAYIVVDGEVTDPARYEAYKKLAQAAIAKHGGRYLVRGGETTCSRANGSRGASSSLEFPSADAIRRFYDSPEYQAARAAAPGRGADEHDCGRRRLTASPSRASGDRGDRP